MANKPTNKAVVLEATSMRLAGLLAEGLPYIDAWTPTDINAGGCGVFADLLTDQLDRLGIKYKIVALFPKGDAELRKESEKYFKDLKNFIGLVVAEIIRLKENATQEEKDKLDIQRLNPWSAWSCIYGLMTGSADSPRANSLQQKMFTNHGARSTKETFSQWLEHTERTQKFNGYTALEVYITLKGTNLGDVVSYIKGEIDSIKL